MPQGVEGQRGAGPAGSLGRGGPGTGGKGQDSSWMLGAWLGSNHSGLDPPPVSTSSQVALG